MMPRTGAAFLVLVVLTVSISSAVLAAQETERDAGGQGVDTLEGRVVDGVTGAPIPFVNVGVPGAAKGTVGDRDGGFALAGVPTGAVVVFSAIGYETRSVPSHEFPEDDEIALTALGAGYRETLTVTAQAAGEPIVLGTRYKERGYGFGFASGLLGAEIGARIRIDAPTFLESANFIVTHTGGERFLYRVNIYDFSAGEVGENLLGANVIVAAKQERGTLTVDLRDQRLIVRNDVLLSLEWIQDDRDTGIANVMFRARPRSRADLYFKLTSQMPFQKLKRHSLGFYLVGTPLD